MKFLIIIVNKVIVIFMRIIKSGYYFTLWFCYLNGWHGTAEERAALSVKEQKKRVARYSLRRIVIMPPKLLKRRKLLEEMPWKLRRG